MADKILCPWCGAEMWFPKRAWEMWSEQPTGEDPPEDAKWWARGKCMMCGALSPIVYGHTEGEARNDAKAAALRRYTPPIKPMAFEDVERIARSDNIDDEIPLYLETVDGYARWEIGYRLSYLCRVEKDDYGKTWRYWERKPTDEERGAAEWET